MIYLIIALQIFVAFSVLNTWLLRYNQPSKWRAGNAGTILEEFEVFGLPDWSCYAIGTIKVLLSILLVMAVWYPELKQLAALGLAITLLGAVVLHIKAGDPFIKSLPAAFFFVLCLVIAYFG
jgi:hypothetical protein